MLSFFRHADGTVYAVQHSADFSNANIEALTWLFDGAVRVSASELQSFHIGPRPEMITPWSTTAVEITQTMGLTGIERIEFFVSATPETAYDPMLLRAYEGINEGIFAQNFEPAAILKVEDIEKYNEEQGLALSEEEIVYLKGVVRELGRPLTDSELFGFSQVNSEHCRHKIFGGTFVIDGEEKERSLFKMIKDTSAANPNRLVSAYKDNVAFNQGPRIEQFAPSAGDTSSYFGTKEIDTVVSLKAETHNFPTTVEPFNGAATGSGGEIRDRLAGGKASIPLAGTAVYMTSYTRDDDKDRKWEQKISARPWLYQTPQQILTKASNGASDFGNKFGQPLICGSVLTFEHQENDKTWGYDKVIMLAGGVGFANKRDALKGKPEPGEKVIVMGGDNYRIGMGGGAVSSVNTGEMKEAVELNAIQRSNPEMQKRVANVVRSLAESDDNPIISIHDHGAGGHLNCLSELIEETGGHIDMDRLPVGDPTLSAKEIIGNESQERMGLLVKEKDIERISKIAERERAPLYVVGETTNDMALVFEKDNGEKPIDLALQHMFGSAPKTIMTDRTVETSFADPDTTACNEDFAAQVEAVLRLEAVACKDWLTNKVDRSVTGRVARQQCQGELQLPLSDLGAMSLDFRGKSGIATSVGHAPVVALANPAAGSRLAIAEALTNLIGAPIEGGMEAISLSANWMWPCRNAGEDARLYEAVEACSDFAIKLGINIPTGKDSLSMTQKYPSGEKVVAPGTLIVSAAAEIGDVRKIVGPVIKDVKGSGLIHVDFSFCKASLGGSAFYQTLGKVGNDTPDVMDSEYFADAYLAVSELINKGDILAIHDISAGGLITTLLEMTFANTKGGLDVNLQATESDLRTLLFAENPGVVIQVAKPKEVMAYLEEAGVGCAQIATLSPSRHIHIAAKGKDITLDIDALRDVWYEASKRMEVYQTNPAQAAERAKNYFHQPVQYHFGADFKGTLGSYGKTRDRKERSGITAAIVRDKGTNGEREMAYALHLAGFDVKDIHMTDLMTGREDLSEVQMLVFCGGFSNSDVLGSAKGWAAGFLYNEKAKASLDAFYARKDTLTLGICNGCQLLGELGLLYPEHEEKHRMVHNLSARFESGFVSLEIPANDTVMFGSLSGQKIGVWIAHGEGKFDLPYTTDKYSIVAKYLYDAYPANPNGSPEGIAALASPCGRHIAMMPHPERCIFPWQCGYYPEREGMDVTPWFEAFVNAFEWCRIHKS
ncbi:phosphoribosylformylglycinamidine synthase [Porphyromonas sp.]|uniref:phosphoribosylformylglycinamidine synthase n=1 Tax=Porphyromonas sp. TaxID=1924944 RepID=UPI0026DC92BD|nr:phosphoribosylformylglycinamidine synthase [Porphyromonas sp.]MDO4771202.1 phosphoribosylformylglycinamidine synthase [Porphyromonas sp.]